LVASGSLPQGEVVIHSKVWRTRRLNFISLIWIALVGLGTATAQTTAPTPLTPAQQKAEAAREAHQAAQQQAAQKRAEAAQARSAAKTKTATTAPATNTAAGTPAKSTTAAPNTIANPAGTGTNAATPPTTASKTNGSGAVGSGTLAWQTRVYRSTGCVHNGNSAVCTFTFANQGNEATLVAGSEMAGIQLVDDAHVPHHATAAHFLDKYGTQQPRLVVQPGDSGTYVVTFPDVNSQVTTGDFHLRQQIVGGVTFSSAASGTGTTAGTGAPAKATDK
jgi:hypothetical protein